MTLDLLQVCYGVLHINGCGNIAIEDAMVDILAMMRSGRYDLSSLVTHEFNVDRIAGALDMGANANQAQKVCISFETA